MELNESNGTRPVGAKRATIKMISFVCGEGDMKYYNTILNCKTKSYYNEIWKRAKEKLKLKDNMIVCVRHEYECFLLIGLEPSECFATWSNCIKDIST